MPVTREQWMLSRALAGAINAGNAPFCSEVDEEAETTRDPTYVANVAAELASLCSRMALEDTVEILDAAILHLQKDK